MSELSDALKIDEISPEEAIALARAAHPEDEGLLIRYVFPNSGWRIYAHQG